MGIQYSMYPHSITIYGNEAIPEKKVKPILFMREPLIKRIVSILIKEGRYDFRPSSYISERTHF